MRGVANKFQKLCYNTHSVVSYVLKRWIFLQFLSKTEVSCKFWFELYAYFCKETLLSRKTLENALKIVGVWRQAHLENIRGRVGAAIQERAGRYSHNHSYRHEYRQLRTLVKCLTIEYQQWNHPQNVTRPELSENGWILAPR